MFRFLLGEIAVCVFVLGLFGSLLLTLYGMGYLLKRLAYALYPHFQQFTQTLQGRMQASKPAVVFVGASPAVLARVASRAA